MNKLRLWTGLKDKNNDIPVEVYEYDIIDENGYVIGNVYETPEIYKEKTHLIIPPITSRKWENAYKEAMGRGLTHSK